MDNDEYTQSDDAWVSPYLDISELGSSQVGPIEFEWCPESEAESAVRLDLRRHRQHLLEAFDECVAKGYTPLPGGPLDERSPRVRWGRMIHKKPSLVQLDQLRGFFSRYMLSGKFDWREPPKLMIITGTLYRLVVVDVDPRNGGHVTIKGYETPDTYQVNTPGGGYHLYYRIPPGMRVKSAKLPGVDIQAGCLVAAPPSRRSDGVYVPVRELPVVQDLTMAPAWVLDLIGDDNQSEAGRSSRNRRTGAKRPGHMSKGPTGSPSPKDGTPPGALKASGEEMHKLLHLLNITHDCETAKKQNVLCPMHDDESSPSLSVDLVEGTWNCHHNPSCGKGGVQDLKRALRAIDRILPNHEPRTAHALPSPPGDIRSKLAVCENWRERKNVKHLAHLDDVARIGRTNVVPCNDCRGCRRFNLETRLIEARDRWPLEEPAYLITVDPERWDALRQRIDDRGRLYVRAPQRQGQFAVVTTHGEGEPVNDLALLLDGLLHDIPINIRGEGRTAHNLTISEELQPPKRSKKPRTGVTRMVQDPDRLRRKLGEENRIRTEHGDRYSFDMPDGEGWEAEYGIDNPRLRGPARTTRFDNPVASSSRT